MKTPDIKISDIFKFKRPSHVIIIYFIYYGYKFCEKYENSDSIINRDNLKIYFLYNYYTKTFFIFILNWLFIIFCRYYQIFINKQNNI